MGAVYKFLGLTVGCILHDQPPHVRREQYNCDITYGTNAEFGFDYLRDNGMATRKEEQVQRGHYFAIVDEVDSILIDEARTPLIISGPAVHTLRRAIRPVEAARSNRSSARRNGCAPGSCPRPKSCSKSCARPTARIRRTPTRSNGKSACCCSASKSASRKSEGLMKIAGRPGESEADEQGGAAVARGPEEGRALRARRKSCSSPSTRRATRPTSPRRAAIS